MIEIRNGMIFDFYTRLSHIVSIAVFTELDSQNRQEGAVHVKSCSSKLLHFHSSSLSTIFSYFPSLSLSPSLSIHVSYPLSSVSPPPPVQVALAQAGRLPLCEGGPLDDKKQEGNIVSYDDFVYVSIDHV